MWQVKDSKLISKFNMIVKNLPKNITSKSLNTLFSEVGHVFSCKIPKNSKNNSEGFGFVCFYEEEALDKAIEKFNNCDYEGKKLRVEKYDKSQTKDKEEFFHNLYFKNFPKEWTEEKVKSLFESFGTLTSFKVEMAEDSSETNKG